MKLIASPPPAANGHANGTRSDRANCSGAHRTNGHAAPGQKPTDADRSAPDIHRTLPHSVEAEQGVLGSMLVDPPQVIGDCVERINEGYFYQPAHATLYSILVEFWNEGHPADVITLTQALRDRKLLEEVGGPAYITHLFTFTPTSANASYYIEIVREKYILRQLIRAGTEVAAKAYEDMGEVDEQLDQAESRIMAISGDARKAPDAADVKSLVLSGIEAIEKLYQRKGEIGGLPTGFRNLDLLTDGLHPCEMYVIAARPSMGKTAFCCQIAEHAAVHERKPTAIFSLEMSSQQLIQRMLCSRARVNLGKVRDGFLTERDFPSLTRAASLISEAPLYIDDTAALSVLELRAKARRFKQTKDIQLIVIDYLQLLRGVGRRSQDNRQQEVSEISTGIKALAKELRIPIIVLAQLNRNPEGRAGGKPRMSDLRESGSIEADADLVGLLTRAEYYADDEEGRQEVQGEAELIVAKQRNGPVGELRFTFLKEFTRFEERADPPKGQ